MNLLPKWVLPSTMPSIYDSESFTSLEMVSKVYGAMNTLIEEYNLFADRVNSQLIKFTEDETQNREEFETNITKIYRAFTCQMQDYLQLNLEDTATNILFKSISAGNITIPTDTTLTKTAHPADAAAVGAQIAAKATALSQEIAAERARISELTANNGSSTEGNAELVDIRTSYDGIIYPTAGDAVRAQAAVWNVVYPKLPSEWVDGIYIKGDTGEAIANTALSATAPIDISKYAGMAVEIRCRTWNTQGFAFYDNTNKYITGVTGYTHEIHEIHSYIATVPENAAYIRITTLIAEKDKCYVRPALSVPDLLSYAAAIMDYKKLPFEWVDGVYIKGDTGDVPNNVEFAASNPVNISKYAGMSIEVKCRLYLTQGFAFYDKTHSYIFGVCGNDLATATQENTVYKTVIPENAVYIRICTTTDKKEGCYIKPLPTIDEILSKISKGETIGNKRIFSRRIAMFGDSITLGRDGDGDSTARTTHTIPATVAEMLGVDCINYGVGSIGYVAKGDSGRNAYEHIATTDLANFDTITLCFGVNDHSTVLGTWNSVDESTVMGQFNKCINYIYGQNPAARVIVIAPFNGRNVGQFPDYWYGEPWGSIETLLKTACEYYGIPFISQRSGPINGFTIETLIGADGVHPNEIGYQRIGEWIAGEMRRLIG